MMEETQLLFAFVAEPIARAYNAAHNTANNPQCSDDFALQNRPLTAFKGYNATLVCLPLSSEGHPSFITP